MIGSVLTGKGGGAGFANPIIAKTEAEMNALLIESNVGKYVKYMPEEVSIEKVWSPVSHIRTGDYLDTLYFNINIAPDFSQLNWDCESTTLTDGTVRITLFYLYGSSYDTYIYAYKTATEECSIKRVMGDAETIIYSSSNGWAFSTLGIATEAIRVERSYQQPIWEQWISKDGNWEEIKAVDAPIEGEEFNALYFNYDMNPTYQDSLDWINQNGSEGVSQGGIYVMDANDKMLVMLMWLSVYDGYSNYNGDTSMGGTIVLSGDNAIYANRYQHTSTGELNNGSWFGAFEHQGWDIQQRVLTKEYLLEQNPTAVEPLKFSYGGSDLSHNWMNWNLLGQLVSKQPFPLYKSGQAYVVTQDNTSIVAKPIYALESLDNNATVMTIQKGSSAYNDKGELVEGTAKKDRTSEFIVGEIKALIDKEYFDGMTTISPYSFAGKKFFSNGSNPNFIIFNNITDVGAYAFAGSSQLRLELEQSPNRIVFKEGALSAMPYSELDVYVHRPFSIIGARDNTSETNTYVKIDNWDIFNNSEGSWFKNKGYYSGVLIVDNMQITTIEETNTDITTFGESILEANTTLTVLKMPATVTSIGRRAFKDCNITTADLSKTTVKVLEEGTFEHCQRLNTISFPESLISIGEKAFYEDSALSTINIPSFRNWCLINFKDNPLAYSTASRLCVNGESLSGNIQIDTDIEQIPAYTFRGNNSITNITIPTRSTFKPDDGSVSALRPIIINNDAFIDSTVTNAAIGYSPIIGERAFKNCVGIRGSIIFVQGHYYSTIKSTTIDNVTIGESAFEGCTEITNITLRQADGAISYGSFSFAKNAFKGCIKLTSLSIDGIAYMSELALNDTAFDDCTNLRTLSGIRQSVVSSLFKNPTLYNQITELSLVADSGYINNELLKNFNNLVSLTARFQGNRISSGKYVWSMGQYACYNCSELQTFTLNSGGILGTIDFTYKRSCFEDCKKMTNFTLGRGVTGETFTCESRALWIGSETNKATITSLETTPPTIASDTFNASYLEKIIVPVGCGEVYKAATNWSAFANYIEEASA